MGDMMQHVILVLGSGGREHALCYRLSKSQHVQKIYAATGNSGISEVAETVSLEITNPQAVLEFCQSHQVTFVVIGSEAPAAAGIGDILNTHNIPVFGCSQRAAALEASKSFTKDLCKKLSVPTAHYVSADSLEEAKSVLETFNAPYVLKADGLAAGKGVIIAESKEKALESLQDIFAGAFGQAGHRVVIEEFLTGEEASFFILSDGKNIIPFGTAQDHKRAYDDDQGPNTGGMGAYSPASIMTEAVQQQVINQIIQPVITEMYDEGMPFVGVLYAGLMLTEQGAKLIEFNVRFGDPECQILMMRLQSDLFPILYAAATGKLGECSAPEWSQDYAVTVVMAAEGYPTSDIVKGTPILLPQIQEQEGMIFHAGTAQNNDGQLIANGGRVLNITAMGASVSEATQKAYEIIDKIEWEYSFYRKDIAYREINREHDHAA